MNLKILYNNESGVKNFMKSWGFSCLVETDKNNVLFDTGWDGNVLLHNMELFDVKPENIQNLVLSHQDWDHIGGLNHILAYTDFPDLYVPKSFSENLKNEIRRYSNLFEVSNPVEICEGVYSTGELGNEKIEQSLILQTVKGVVILTGCAHPGLENIIKTAKRFGKIYGVVGGLHDLQSIDFLEEIPFLMPCHCTEHKNDIKTAFPDSYHECGNIIFNELG
jgi:7,8-dihydropterin-6-yl-methyl-4-(beta-D-ribofuranosyl)aminobenzene 5'-phosphate synthase